MWYFSLIYIWNSSTSSFLGQLTVAISGKFLAMYSLKFYAFLPLPCTSTTWEGLTRLMNSVVWAQSACAAKLIS
jgi:hypothetical protein